MKVTGFLLLIAGWIIVLTALWLLKRAPVQASFIVAGLGVEVVGLILVAQSHRIFRADRP